jgi:hypothetical protein
MGLDHVVVCFLLRSGQYHKALTTVDFRNLPCLHFSNLLSKAFWHKVYRSACVDAYLFYIMSHNNPAYRVAVLLVIAFPM